MCGIAGFTGFNNNLELAQQANQVQKHRGPDNQSVWHDDFIAFAHQRLSIIDLSTAANQPLVKDDWVIVFNGEIYNYIELKNNILNQHNIQFNTTSDTEVVLEMYRLMREKCLDHFIGMFSFVIYNQTTREIFAARDHFGIKPFFYVQQNGKFAFASELKTLMNLPGIAKEINYQTLVASLNYLWVPGNDSMFRQINKLPPAHFLKFDRNQQFSIKKYWQKSVEQNLLNLSENDIIEKLKTEFDQSIQRHTVADVPVSSFLSGGLDSSLISVATQEYTRQKLSVYTIATRATDKKTEKMPDDEKYAQKLAKIHNFDYNEIIIQPDMVEMLPKIVWHLDEPIGDPAAINTFLICDAARKRGVKILLSGMGADEIFFGYRRQKALLLAQKFNQLPALTKKLIHFGVNLLPVKIGNRGIKLTRWSKRFLSFTGLPDSQAYMRSYSYYNSDDLATAFHSNFQPEIEKIKQQHDQIFNAACQNDIINQVCNTDISMFMNGLNLTYSDRASMAASVELRVPFIDREMVNFAMQIPGSLKYKNIQQKYILKKAAEKYLPHEIIYRPKASFGAPLRSWISGELKEMVNDLLSENQVKKRGIFNPAFIKKLIENDRRGFQDNAYQIYQLLTIEIWMQQFFDA